MLLSVFTISYALSSISIFLFIGFFLLDTKENIKKKWRNILKNKINILFVLFFGAQLIGILYSSNLDYAVNLVSVMLPIVFLPAILSVERLTKTDFNFIIGISKITIVVPFLYYIFVHVLIDQRELNGFVHFTVEQKLGISQFYLMFILFIPIIASINAIIKKQKIALHILLLMTSIGIVFLLGNTTSLFFMLLIWIILIVQTYKRKKIKSLVPIFMGVFLFFAALQLPIINQKLDVFTKTLDFDMETIITKNRFTITKNTFEHRILIDYLAMEEIINALPFGIGTGDYQEALNHQYDRINFKAGMEAEFNNHNQYLAEFLKTGFIGGVLFLLLMFFLLKQIKDGQKFYPYFIIFFSMACLVESYLDRQHGIVIFAFLIPFFLYNDKND